MGASFLFILLFLGVACGHKHHPTAAKLATLLQQERDIFSRQSPEHFENAIDSLWELYTNNNSAPPHFQSPTYKNKIIGKHMETIKGRAIYAWQGIEFGKPPVGDLRFKPTVPTDRYEGAKDPLEFDHLPKKCPQMAMIGSNAAGSEDCLGLNVYTPYLPGTEEAKDLPVMLFIYGGAFTSGDSSMYLPTKLLDHDVILVTIHYRLGAFGFLNLQNDDAPGNPALYDMVEAIRWTHKYIKDFGGNPEQVTVFGESAGSVSAGYMLLLPQVKDLIHGIICESGSVIDVWGLDPRPREAAEYIANYLNCTYSNDHQLYSCLKDADQDLLVEAQMDLVGYDRRHGLMGFRGAAPSVQYYNGDKYEVLLTKPPIEYYYDRELNNVPMMLGANKQEGSYVLGVMYWSYFVANGLLNNSLWMNNSMVETIMGSFAVNDNSHALSDSFVKLYCPGVPLDDFDAVAPCLIDMVGVMFLKSGAWQTANLHRYFTNKNTYFYSFEFESDDSMYKWLLGEPPFDPGVTHSDELMYLFSMPAVMEGQQIVTMDRMTLLWTNFATYGNPTPDEPSEPWQALNIPAWPEYLTDDRHFMLMSDQFTTDIAEYSDRWTITLSELRGHDTTNPTWEEYDQIVEENDSLEDDKKDLEDERDAYMAAMIVFIVLFVIAVVGGVYFFIKAR